MIEGRGGCHWCFGNWLLQALPFLWASASLTIKLDLILFQESLIGPNVTAWTLNEDKESCGDNEEDKIASVLPAAPGP